MTLSRPYHLPRQVWLGQALDDLARRGRLRWGWAYDTVVSRAKWMIAEPGRPTVTLLIKQAEQLVQRHYDELGVAWMPVAHPGGQEELDEVRRLLGVERPSDGGQDPPRDREPDR